MWCKEEIPAYAGMTGVGAGVGERKGAGAQRGVGFGGRMVGMIGEAI